MVENIIRVRIPMERIGVLIGASGEAKAAIERRFRTKIEVEGRTGDVEIIPDSENPDPVAPLRARDTVVAIGRGFSPESAFRLFNEEINLGVIDLRDIFGRSDSDISRVKGRIIGVKGKARRLIEELSGANICVYGHTVAIIGGQGQFDTAKEAVERLIRGDLHKNVYDFLQKKRRELKLKEIELWQAPEQFSETPNSSKGKGKEKRRLSGTSRGNP